MKVRPSRSQTRVWEGFTASGDVLDDRASLVGEEVIDVSSLVEPAIVLLEG
jgi:hypothetical protein